ncbi:MAG: transcription elongation factor [Nitrosomonadales bacterium]|jgi:transcription elongation GreA/GreB family factor|nr:transcription elongation factor [Nitrosomonadales bacterium]MBT3918168.1 transcription elongation factor [Nitrosomonadales bacterium]MBT4182465.1 transcription elongation factor [Nitrosomonadales bacterium]MBT4760034.1 transcription elongation factor [Nitrosomonadales bacterium]MBT5150389.1 transcription elongation factor [Nitrosomonadales bacterium]
MSRAFVKENDLEHAGIDVPERPISAEKNYVTPSGLKELEVEIALLETERTKLSPNSDSINKQKKMQLERDLRYFINRLESAILVRPLDQDKDKVLFSALVDVENELGNILNFQIVGEDESNIKMNKIAYTSPLAKALIGNAVGDEVVWNKPSSDEILTIVKIQYKI